MGRRPEQKCFQRRTDGQQAHGKMPNMPTNQRKANQNNNILPPICQNGYHQKTYKQQTGWRGCGEKEPLCTVDENVSLTQPLMKTVGKFLRQLKTELPQDPAILFWGINPGKNANLKRNMQPNVHSTIYNSQDMEAI